MAFSIDNFFDIKTEFPYDKEKESFIEHMNFLKSMSVQESTLYKNWKQWNYEPHIFLSNNDIIKIKRSNTQQNINDDNAN